MESLPDMCRAVQAELERQEKKQLDEVFRVCIARIRDKVFHAMCDGSRQAFVSLLSCLLPYPPTIRRLVVQRIRHELHAKGYEVLDSATQEQDWSLYINYPTCVCPLRH
jgi:hypothetical protein